MFKDLGWLFGWLLIISIASTILNYCIKLVNRHFGKKISAHPIGKKTMKVLMSIFVRNHRYFGGGAVALLLIHFILQFTKYGLNLSGGLAALLLLFQVSLGIYAIVRKKPRRGTWFITHRVIAALLIIGIAIHLLVPYALNVPIPIEDSSKVSETLTDSARETFTVEELSDYNGQDGNKAYVAYKGVVYDISAHPKWTNGMHNGNIAGTDLTNEISKSPHGPSKFDSLEIVGVME